MIKKIISLIVETKICSKFEKPVPPTPQYIEFYSKKGLFLKKVIYFLLKSKRLIYIYLSFAFFFSNVTLFLIFDKYF